ncbi:Acyl-CoA N-acyltransferase [Akanthomyces lecanii RCEF 1005]|uniref:Acyl-CoA N-acyltransferase n=1 Tax=Akanthomyces lecanii RCEF 1005 TaxID=1081108 RepID=A0A168HMI1_CORDF|nr:Acyl-CoA N-acyltransferase [Akanthomyces lecanii RCEF 1005]
MKLELQDVDFADGGQLALVQAAASASDDLLQALHPGLSFGAAVAASKERWLSVYGFAPWHHKKVVDADTGKIVAVSRWMVEEAQLAFLPPRTGIPAGAVIPPRQRPATLDLDLAMRFGEQAGAVFDRCVQERPNMTLDMWSVLPEYRESDAANLMLKWATKFADEQSIVCYLESGPAESSIYLKHGFESFDTIAVSTRGGDVTREALVRDPKARTDI